MAKTPPKSRSEVIKDLYSKSLGSFISLFTIAEATLKALLAKTAGVDPPIANALFSGTRADQAISFLRRCYEARGQPIPEELDAILAQLAAIGSFRNDVVHQRADFSRTPPVLTNRANIISERALRETPIEPETLYDAGCDLGVIMLGLAAYMHDDPKKRGEDLKYVFSTPWRHKPASPTSSDPGRQKATPRPRRKAPQKPFLK